MYFKHRWAFIMSILEGNIVLDNKIASHSNFLLMGQLSALVVKHVLQAGQSIRSYFYDLQLRLLYSALIDYNHFPLYSKYIFHLHFSNPTSSHFVFKDKMQNKCMKLFNCGS